MKRLLMLLPILFLLGGCDEQKPTKRSIESVSANTGAAMSSYPTASSVVDGDKALISKSTASNATQQAAMSTVKNYVLSDVLDFSATSPLNFNSTTGALSLIPWESQSALETWLGWSFSGSGGSNYVAMTAEPYSDVPCTTGSYGYYGSTGYLCTGGFWASKWELAAHVNPTPGPTLILDDTLYSAATVEISTYTLTPGPGGAWSAYTNTVNVGSTGATSGDSSAHLVKNTTQITNGYVVANGKTSTESVTRAFGPCARMDSSIQNGYCSRLDGTGILTVDKYVSGVRNVIGTATCSGHVVADYYDVFLNVTSTGVSARVELLGAEQCSIAEIADTTYTTGGLGMLLSNTAPKIIDIKAYEN